MRMAIAAGPWTVAQRDLLPDDGNRYEVVDGELLVTPMPVPRHEITAKRLFLLLHAFVEREGLGSAFPSRADVIFDKHNIVVPDAVVFPLRDEDLPKRWADVPKPILVVEVRSPTTWRRDTGAKRRLYVEREVPEYWIVNDEDREVTIVRPGREDELVTDVVRWHPHGANTALEIELAEVFA